MYAESMTSSKSLKSAPDLPSASSKYSSSETVWPAITRVMPGRPGGAPTLITGAERPR